MISNKMSEFESLVVIDTADKESSSTQTFQEYKKVHEKQVMQALSTLTKKTEIEETSNALQTTLSEFHFNLYAKVKEFTSAFHDLKNAIQTHTRQKYMDFGSVLMARNESLVSEIESYNPFQECGGVMVEEDDCEPEWNQFIQSEFLPFEFGEMLMAVMVQVRNSGRNLLTFTNVSSQEWVPSSMSMDILKAGLKCCQEIKFLVQFCVKMSEKMYSNSSEESRMREMWRRRCLQSEKVKDMFKLWQKQIKMGEVCYNFTFSLTLEII